MNAIMQKYGNMYEFFHTDWQYSLTLSIIYDICLNVATTNEVIRIEKLPWVKNSNIS